jgi:Na+/melibiose symporter-like transporter
VTGRRVSFWRISAYATPALPLAIVMFPSYTILPGFYAEHTQVTLAFIGVALIASRIFDAVIDPVIGHFCDLTPARWGGRKLWLVCGSLVPLQDSFSTRLPRAQGRFTM